jgi:HD-like signal output (HDOD) protein
MSNSQRISALIAKAEQLHSAPEVARTLLNLTRDVDFDIAEVVECLERDPASVARLLRLVNSSRYGLGHRVSNPRQAVAFLGQRTVRLIAMTFGLIEGFTRGPARHLYVDFWKSALSTATVADRLTRETPGIDSQDAYTAGLLANLGTLVLAQAESDWYLEKYPTMKSGFELAAAEREAFGFDHAAVAATLLKQWEFPAVVVQAIAHHHAPDSEIDHPLTAAVKAGDLVGDVLWIQGTPSTSIARGWLQDRFGLDIDGFTQLALSCKDEITLEAEIYGVELGQPIDCEALLQQAQSQCFDASLAAAIEGDSVEAVMNGIAELPGCDTTLWS